MIFGYFGRLILSGRTASAELFGFKAEKCINQFLEKSVLDQSLAFEAVHSHMNKDCLRGKIKKLCLSGDIIGN